jgi:TPR repeat protein
MKHGTDLRRSNRGSRFTRDESSRLFVAWHAPTGAAAVVLLCVGLLNIPAARAESETDAMARAVAANQARDFTTSLAIYRTWTASGSAAAPSLLGLMYWVGAGVPVDHRQACDLYATAEQRGDPKGTELLADCFYHGDGRTRDYAQSALLYRRASGRGMAQADCALGNQFLLGLGVDKDLARAFSLCEHSAELGAPDAQADLGQMYLAGQGVPRDPQEAARWLRKAMDQGQANAALVLGKMFWNGDGVERDHRQAAQAWLIAAQRQNPSAPALLARYYFVGALSSGQNRVIVVEPASKAAYWGTLASRLDPDPAQRQQSEQLVNMLLKLAPGLKARVDEMLAGPIPPGI